MTHQRRIIPSQTSQYHYVSYCTKCDWTTGGGLPHITKTWTNHIDQIAIINNHPKPHHYNQKR